MNIRRFRAHSVSEALALVKSELGDDAVILNTTRKRVKDGATGAVSAIVEVVAAVDFDTEVIGSAASDDAPAGEGTGFHGERNGPAVRVHEDDNAPPRGPAGQPGAGEPESGSSFDQTPLASAAGEGESAQEQGALHAEIRELRAVVERLAGGAASSGHVATDSFDKIQLGASSSSRYPLMVVHEVFDLLGIEAGLQRSLAAAFFSSVPNGRPVNHRTVYAWLKRHCEKLMVSGPQAEAVPTPCWWAFIGPTGVGKTTTLAKLAAHMKFKHGLRGHLVTVDTYRLGGVEQLQKYAELMEIPFSTARNTAELVEIFSRNRELDFILVDTIGRNSRSSRHQIELEKLFDAVPGLQAQALLCASYKPEDMLAAVKTYRKFPVCGWTLSKADETVSAGCLYSPVIGWKLPLSYITDGQKVPEDIKPASRENVMRLLFAKGDTHFSGDRYYHKANRASGKAQGSSRSSAECFEGQL